MRIIAKIEKGGEFYPGPKGIRFNAELLPELRAALEAAEGVIEQGKDVGDTPREGG